MIRKFLFVHVVNIIHVVLCMYLSSNCNKDLLVGVRIFAKCGMDRMVYLVIIKSSLRANWTSV